MKKQSLTLLAMMLATMLSAHTVDSTRIESLDEIINTETTLKSKEDINTHYKSVWGKNYYLNIGINSAKISSDDFPKASGGTYSMEYENKFGFSIQNGKSCQFNKKPYGNFLFVGLDVTWLDINANNYEKVEPAVGFDMGDSSPYHMPWHHKKWMASYGMSLGPSVTLYPFTSINNSSTDNIRLHLYFHIGYSVGGVLFDSVKKPDSMSEKTQAAWGHGLFTAFGASLTWKFIGIGYEVRNNSTDKYIYLNSSFKQPDRLPLKESIGRFYFQFRFK